MKFHENNCHTSLIFENPLTSAHQSSCSGVSLQHSYLDSSTPHLPTFSLFPPSLHLLIFLFPTLSLSFSLSLSLSLPPSLLTLFFLSPSPQHTGRISRTQVPLQWVQRHFVFPLNSRGSCHQEQSVSVPSAPTQQSSIPFLDVAIKCVAMTTNRNIKVLSFWLKYA